jgi:hypothetical protein
VAIPKTPENLDAMVSHVRYEAIKLVQFLTVGNGWVPSLNLRADVSQFASESIFEAGALHMRALVEFLQDTNDKTRVTAHDYVDGWSLPDEQRISGKDYGDLHARVAHIGMSRVSVSADGPFDWGPYLRRNAPIVLAAFRTFLRALTPERSEQFAQPRPDMPRVELLPILDSMLGAAPSP